MTLFVTALWVLALGGALSWCFRNAGPSAKWLSPASAMVGCALGFFSVAPALFDGGGFSASLKWGFPIATFALGTDALSALFLAILFALGAVTALFGAGYLRNAARPARAAASWLGFNLLLVSMALALVSRHALLFLAAWEGMTVASFFLVAYETESPASRRAAWTYLVAAHLGGAFVAVLFILMAAATGSWNFQDYANLRYAGASFKHLLFLLALIGFGTKAGFFPLHVWLPDAHPAAPSHVSALMSGVMIKTGIYGLLRIASMLGTPPAWWGWLLVGIGAISGVLGVLLALTQHDIKRLLAYCSVENIGIITLGLGVGFLGWHYGAMGVLAAGLAGGLMHVVNHALFKGLLFLGAGAVLHATGCRNMERLGGLIKRMPVTGATFMLGAAAIAGLPPWNGFLSEFLIYLSALRMVQASSLGMAVPAAVVVCALALIGGLAAACFVKAVGVIFLGEPRDPILMGARESAWSMRAPMLLLAGACGAIGLFGWVSIGPLFRAAAVLTGPQPEQFFMEAPGLKLLMADAAVFGAGVAVFVIVFAMARRSILRKRSVARASTWDCGYARPSARMQYTAASFAQPLTDLFQDVLRPKRDVKLPSGFFPENASWETHPEDMAREQMYRPVFNFIERVFAKIRRLQEGRVQVYLLYMAITLLVLLLTAL